MHALRGSISIEKSMLFVIKNTLPCQCIQKGKILNAKSIDFPMKIDPQIACKMRQKFYNFYFMLQMYFLMLVSTASAWGRFWGPTDPENHQILRSISHNPLQ